MQIAYWDILTISRNAVYKRSLTHFLLVYIDHSLGYDSIVVFILGFRKKPSITFYPWICKLS